MIEPKLVEFQTKDKLMLPGLLYKAKNSKKVAIFLHGNGSSSVFYDNYLHEDLPRGLAKKGISLLKFNNRGAHIFKKLNVISKKLKQDRKKFGCAYEVIKESVLDIDGAVSFLEKEGFNEFYLIGVSTGANKICVYNHYKPKNKITKYVLVCGGDDTGIYYDFLGDKLFFSLLEKAKQKIKARKSEEIIPELLDIGETFSYKGFYDIASPNGDYNCFPFSEILGKVKLSTKPLLRYFTGIKTSSIVIYGEKDEYCWGEVRKLVGIMKEYKPEFQYRIIKDTDHGFNGKKKELAKEISEFLG